MRVRLVFRRSRVRSSGPAKQSFVHDIISAAILSLSLIQVGHAVVSDWRNDGHLVLVNSLGTYPGTVWLGKLPYVSQLLGYLKTHIIIIKNAPASLSLQADFDDESDLFSGIFKVQQDEASVIHEDTWHQSSRECRL